MSSTEKTGYGRPPRSGRFRKGQSGNPKGRPKGRHKKRPYDDLFSRMVTIREWGVRREVPAAEAFALSLGKRAVSKGGPAAELIEQLEERRQQATEEKIAPLSLIALVAVAPGSVTSAIEPLGMARKLDRYSDRARLVLEPWIVEKALARLEAPLSEGEQRAVLAATRAPQKVRWPEWWVLDNNKE